MTYLDFIANKLETVTTENLITLWHEYCEANHYEDQIYNDLEELANLLNDSPLNFAQRCIYGGLDRTNYNYYWLNRAANIEGADFIDGTPIDYRSLADWLIDNEHSELDQFADEWDELQGDGDD